MERVGTGKFRSDLTLKVMVTIEGYNNLVAEEGQELQKRTSSIVTFDIQLCDDNCKSCFFDDYKKN